MCIGVERASHLSHPDLDPGVERAFEAAVAELEAAGAVVREVELPYYGELVDANMVTLLCDALAYHHESLRSQWHAYQRTTRLAYASAVLFSAAEYVRVQQVRRTVRRLVARIFDDVDAIVCPTAATPAPEAGRDIEVAKVMASIFTAYWSCTGHPAISVPMGFSHGLPVGLQVVGRPFDEQTVIAVADVYQQRTDWHRRTPPIAEEAVHV
jgi:aspartyl-tRNA(Asn)/glutamyl-tRNA(Gln) amidotransferase subunit A